jgi:hypothetical protein
LRGRSWAAFLRRETLKNLRRDVFTEDEHRTITMERLSPQLEELLGDPKRFAAGTAAMRVRSQRSRFVVVTQDERIQRSCNSAARDRSCTRRRRKARA